MQTLKELFDTRLLRKRCVLKRILGLGVIPVPESNFITGAGFFYINRPDCQKGENYEKSNYSLQDLS